MRPVGFTRQLPSRPTRRAGFSYRGLALALAVLLAVPAIGWSVLPKGLSWSSSDGGGPMMHRVERGQFIHDITERGDVESASNVEIVSKVKSSRSGGSSGGAAILSIVPEGTVIRPEDCLPSGCVVTHEDIEILEELKRRERLEKGGISRDGTGTEPEQVAGGADIGSDDGEPEDVQPEKTKIGPEYDKPEKTRISPEELKRVMILVQLDSSALENQKIQQEIVVHNSEAVVIQAGSDVKVAEIARNEYLEGTHLESLLEMDIQIKEAEVEKSQAEQYLKFSERLERKGYITKQQLEDDKTRVMKAENALQLAEKKREVLQEFNKKKMEEQLRADIMTAKAKLAAAKASYELDVEQLEEIKEQMVNCTLFATKPGQAVYANREGHHGMGEVIIEEGTLIREHQVIIRLPDPEQMQVEAKINEARVKLVKEGMQVIIELDAVPGEELEGTVESVAQLPAPSGWWSGNVKEYDTIIKILNPGQVDLRPGYTAKVKIRVEQIEDVLQVPVQALIEHGAKHYCVLRDGKGLKAQEVKIGSSNDKFVVIESGLEEGQEVVLNAAAHREEAGLPELSPEAERRLAQPQATDNSAARSKDGQADGGQKAARPRTGQPNAAQLFKRLDKNGDGQLDKDEQKAVPQQFRSRLAAADKNQDGMISRSELTAATPRSDSAGRPGGPRAGDRPGGRPAGNRP